MAERQDARAAKDFARADEIRDRARGDGLRGPGLRRRPAARAEVLMASQIIYGVQPVARGRTGEAARPQGLAGAGDLAGGAGAALRVAGPPGRRRRGRSVSLRRRGGDAAQARRADRRARPGAGPAQPRRGLPLGRVGGRGRGGIPERRAAMVTPVACKTSAGAVEHLEVAHVRNLADWLAAAKEAGFWIWGADADGPAPPWGVDLTGPTVLVLGGEGKGLRPRVASQLRRPGRPAEPRPGRVPERLGGGHRTPLRVRPPALLTLEPRANATAVAKSRNLG